MKKIAFHSNQLGIRGTEVALYDYACGNEDILKNESFIISDKNGDMQALEKFEKRFKKNIFLYDNFYDCYKFCEDNNITDIYYIKAGDNDGKILNGYKNHIHSVFQHKDIHGDTYNYVSEWLAEKMGMPGSFIPHIVDLPKPKINLREKLGIDDTKIVIGRYGGYNELDLPFVYEVINEIVNKRDDVLFLFMNTRPFINHKNVKFIEGSFKLQNKSNFINTCDFMLHARHMGESFGLAICEFLFHDKPVISWKNGSDQNHITILGEKGIWYYDKNSLYDVLLNLQKNNKPAGFYKELVYKFSTENVMNIFNRKLLI